MSISVKKCGYLRHFRRILAPWVIPGTFVKNTLILLVVTFNIPKVSNHYGQPPIFYKLFHVSKIVL